MRQLKELTVSLRQDLDVLLWCADFQVGETVISDGCTLYRCIIRVRHERGCTFDLPRHWQRPVMQLHTI